VLGIVEMMGCIETMMNGTLSVTSIPQRKARMMNILGDSRL
ncbi:MAG: hypothetical protein ACI8RD_005727, partial [Bacillariaceae sp.]